MKTYVLKTLVGLVSIFFSSLSFATLVTFDPYAPINTYVQTPITENGLTFQTGFYLGVNSPGTAPNANNGSNIFVNGYSTLNVFQTNGNPFDLNSFDLGLSWYALAADAVTLTGHVYGGGTVSMLLSLTQSFQTFNLNLLNLTSFDISTPAAGQGYIALDNIVFNGQAQGVPEPLSLLLLAMGIAVLFSMKQRSKSA